MQKINNPYIDGDRENYNCFGCSPNNKTGLNLEFYKDGDSIVAFWNPQKQFEGYQNVVHGGIQATIMDEIASWYIYAMLDTAGVTQKLNVEYHKPLYMNTGEVKITARIKELTEKVAYIYTEILNANGTVCSSGTVEYYLFPSKVAKAKFKYPGKEKFL